MWFSASVITRSEKKDDPFILFEESIYLLQAEDDDDAWKKAEEKGRLSEQSYEAISGDMVTWVFDRVLSVFELFDEEVKDGTEIFSRFLKEEEVKSLQTPFEGD